MKVDVTDVDAQVVEASREQPVVADFWAPWCGPCRMLGPVLERLADEADGEWMLAKINTDQQQEAAQRYHIRGIPAVKLFVDGEVVDEFTGALPEHAIRQWLEKALPSENKQRVAEAEAALQAGEPEEAEPLLRAVLADEPTNPKAQILLAQLLAFSDPDEALQLIDTASFAGPSYVQTAEAVRTVARLQQLEPDDLPEEPGRDAYLAGAEALSRHDPDTALQRFIEVIQTNRFFDDDGARKACVALFTLLGEGHPIVRKHRRTFDMSLY